MADATRVGQVVAEVLIEGDPATRVGQVVAEVLRSTAIAEDNQVPIIMMIT